MLFCLNYADKGVLNNYRLVYVELIGDNVNVASVDIDDVVGLPEYYYSQQTAFCPGSVLMDIQASKIYMLSTDDTWEEWGA